MGRTYFLHVINLFCQFWSEKKFCHLHLLLDKKKTIGSDHYISTRIGNTGTPVFGTIYSCPNTGIKNVKYRYFGIRNNFTIRKLKKFKILIDLMNGNKTHRTKLNVGIYLPISYMILVIFS